jgi:hypothetical protein
MSALGQKQTYALHKGMSALPPKATLVRKAKRNSWSCSEPFANLARQKFRRAMSIPLVTAPDQQFAHRGFP